ncbi:MAG: DUF937 domain-containing protein [Gluconacetobacter diazotrophicus]|nr:DUF937 domain-containing protein [Gluconacetobacter diazotrophicus]
MSGFLGGLKNKAFALAGGDAALSAALARMLESQGGKMGAEQVVKQFEAVGLGDKARSWVGPGPKQPLTTEEVQRVLTSDQARFIASCTGLPLAPLLPLIARLLPLAIEKMAKGNETPKQAAEEAVAEAAPELPLASGPVPDGAG